MFSWKTSIDEFAEQMRTAGLRRAYVVRDADSGGLKPSHRLLQRIVTEIATDQRDFGAHQACFLELGRETGVLLGAFIHWTNRGQAAGGVRFWQYDSLEGFIRDGLRLSRGMGRKNALAGLWWGGGKGVIARGGATDHRDPDFRQRVFHDYGRFITGLNGCYVTAKDVGTQPLDMLHVHQQTRYTTCIPANLGGSGNPSVLTAKGVVVAMEAALEFRGRGSLAGKVVAMQGLGNVATHMIDALLERDVAGIVGTDIDRHQVDEVSRHFNDDRLELNVTLPGDLAIFGRDADVLAPNAIGAVLNPTSIATIKAQIVCGAANNQLDVMVRDSEDLRQRGLLYVPDFLANRMGIVNCANEQYGVIRDDPAVEAHLDRKTPYGIFQRSLEVFKRSEKSGRTTAQEAVSLADDLSLEMHPIWGNRSAQIIAGLVKSGWDRDAD